MKMHIRTFNSRIRDLAETIEIPARNLKIEMRQEHISEFQQWTGFVSYGGDTVYVILNVQPGRHLVRTAKDKIDYIGGRNHFFDDDSVIHAVMYGLISGESGLVSCEK